MVTYSERVTLNAFADLRMPLSRVRLVTFELDNNRWGLWVPGQAIITLDDDEFIVTAPSGGAGVVATVAVYGGKV